MEASVATRCNEIGTKVDELADIMQGMKEFMAMFKQQGTGLTISHDDSEPHGTPPGATPNTNSSTTPAKPGEGPASRTRGELIPETPQGVSGES
jgi:hypothetical protein